jgi:uncharacterized protein DUF3883
MNLSPGLAYSCCELLGIIDRRPMSLAHLRASFTTIGVVPASAVIDGCLEMRWLRANEGGLAELTAWGRRLLDSSSPQGRLRRVILDYVDTEGPPWAQNATYGRRRVLSFAGAAVAQVFLEAGLIDGTEEDVVAFWDVLAARARGLRDARLTDVGRRGERLSFEHELRRTGRIPRWVALDDNADGFDLLSIVSRDDARPLSIEVKTTTVGIGATFYLSRNEWDFAQSARRHLFHLWDLSTGHARLGVIDPRAISAHVPCDQGEGIWHKLKIPFRVFDLNGVESGSDVVV